jgi:hypothetical protein
MSEDSLDDVMSGTEPEPVQETVPETTDVKPEVAEIEEPVVAPEPVVRKSESSSDDIVKGLTAELGRIREQNRTLKAEKEPEEKTNIWEDPEKRLGELSSEFDQKLQSTRIAMSENYARRTYDDYDAKLDVFMDMVDKSPLLATQMNAAQDPATFAYNAASEKMILDKVGNVTEFESAVQKSADEKAEAKYKKLYEEQLGQSLPTSLADTRAAADNTSVVNETLDDVIGMDAIHR